MLKGLLNFLKTLGKVVGVGAAVGGVVGVGVAAWPLFTGGAFVWSTLGATALTGAYWGAGIAVAGKFASDSLNEKFGGGGGGGCDGVPQADPNANRGGAGRTPNSDPNHSVQPDVQTEPSATEPPEVSETTPAEELAEALENIPGKTPKAPRTPGQETKAKRKALAKSKM